jgi:hypothetical protein
MVGGSVPVFDEIVLSTELMSNIEELDENSGIVTLQAGVILEKLVRIKMLSLKKEIKVNFQLFLGQLFIELWINGTPGPRC